MFFTLFGIVMLVRPVQLSNAYCPMLVTLSGIVILVKLEQPAKAALSILVTLLGIEKLVFVFPHGYMTKVLSFLL